MSTVPHLDLRRQHAALREELLAAIAGIVDSCGFVGGATVARFEQEFAAACGVDHAVGVASGTDAIKLALRALGVGPGDEVAVPAFTFVATAGAVMECGARPVLVDVERETAHLDAELLARALTDRTRAVVGVHLYGVPFAAEPIRSVAGSVPLVEDCAQAHGARRAGRTVGSLGDLGAFSFYPTKNLGALGDAGAVTTADADLAGKVRVLSDHGRPLDPARRGEHVIPGINSRLDAIQAAALEVKLRRLAGSTSRRRAIAERYREALAGREDVTLQRIPEGAEPVWYLFALRHPRRDALAAALEERGVQARAMYDHALHELPALSHLGHAGGDFPEAEAWGREVLTLPMFAEMTDEEVERVVEVLPEALDAVRAPA